MRALRTTLALTGVALLMSSIGIQPGSADPVFLLARLGVKGPGNSYSIELGPAAPAIAVESVAKGATAQFNFQVTNIGTGATPFAISLVPRTDAPGAPPEMVATTPTVLSNSVLSRKPLPTGPYGFVTPSVAPGKAATYLVNVPMPANAPAGHVWIDATLRTPDGVVQGTAQLVAEQKAPSKGTTPNDIFVSQGGQAAVGSSSYRAVISSPALVDAQTATFTVKLQNDGPVTQSIILRASYVPYCNQVKVKNQFGQALGSNPLLNNYNSSGYLKPRQSVVFHVTMTRPTGNCPHAPAIPNVVELRASQGILGQDPSVSILTYHSVLLVAPYAN